MIIELYKYLTNPATDSAKKLGQLKETIAMEARYHRSKKQWASHLENTKNIIKEAASDVNKKQDVIILGSGLLLDIPIEYLSEQAKHVYLVDVVHLKKVKKAVKKFSNVSLIEYDVTGLADKMLNHSHSTPENFALKDNLTIPYLSSTTGLVVSANMLSQIHLAPVFYAEKHFNYNDTKLEKLAHDIMENHISLLTNTECKVCLITDYKRLYKDKTQTIVSTENVLIDIELPEPDKTWYWEIAPRGELKGELSGELDKDMSMTSLVYAYCDFRI